MVYTVDTTPMEWITTLSIIHHIWAPDFHFTRKCVLAKGSPNIKNHAYNEAVSTKDCLIGLYSGLCDQGPLWGKYPTLKLLKPALNESTPSTFSTDLQVKLQSQNNLQSGHSLPDYSEHGIHLEPQAYGQCLMSVGVTDNDGQEAVESPGADGNVWEKNCGFRAPDLDLSSSSCRWSSNRKEEGREDWRRARSQPPAKSKKFILEFKISPICKSPLLLLPGETNGNLNWE